MAGELRHVATTDRLYKTEYEALNAHYFEGQQVGDMLYADTVTQLKRLAATVDGYSLMLVAGKPLWVNHTALATGVHGAGAGTLASTLTKLTAFAAADDVTTVNVTSARPGLMPKVPNTGGGRYWDETGGYSVPPGGSATAAPRMLAANNASTQEKSFATASGGEVVTGSNDGTRLSAYSGNFKLSAGTFTLNADWVVQSNTRALGEGHATVIDLNGHKIETGNASHIELGNFDITGVGDQANMPFEWGAIDNYCTTSQEDHYFHDIHNIATKCDHFKNYLVGNITMRDVVYERCFADLPDGMGFKNDGESANPHLIHTRYFDCYVKDAGLGVNRVLDSGGVESWTCGFDFAEFSGLHVDDLVADNCHVNGAWRSGFHFETVPVKTGIVLNNCTTRLCGQRTGVTNPFGAFAISGEITLNNCKDFGSLHHIWLYGTATDNITLNDFKGFDALDDGLSLGGMAVGCVAKIRGGGFYRSGRWGLNTQGGANGLVCENFDLVDIVGSGNIANWLDGDDVCFINGKVTCSSAATSGLYTSDGDDMLFTGTRFVVNGYPIYASAATVVRPMVTNIDAYGSASDIDLAAATGEIIKGNKDKTGAWVA